MNEGEFKPNLRFKKRGKPHPDLPKVRMVEEQPHWMPVFTAYKMIPENASIWRMGVCSIIFMPPIGEFMHRMIIACQTRYPTIDEIISAWNQLVPNADGIYDERVVERSVSRIFHWSFLARQNDSGEFLPVNASW